MPDYFNTSMTSYFGGKGSAGTYQRIINQIPEHVYFVSACLGNCAIMRKKSLAGISYGYDLDQDIINNWISNNKKSIFVGTLVIENRSALHLLSRHDLDDTFIYYDPPYPHDTRDSNHRYKFEWTNQDHTNFLTGVSCAKKAQIAISTYPNDLYDEQLKDWRKIKFQSMTRGGPRTEVLYMNYPAPKTLHDYRYIGEDYREREAIKKRIDSLNRKIGRLTDHELGLLKQYNPRL